MNTALVASSAEPQSREENQEQQKWLETEK